MKAKTKKANEKEFQQSFEPGWIESGNERRALLNSITGERISAYVSVIGEKLSLRAVNCLIRLLEVISFACSDGTTTKARQATLAAILKVGVRSVGRHISLARRCGLINCVERFHDEHGFQVGNQIEINWYWIKLITSTDGPETTDNVDLSNESRGSTLSPPRLDSMTTPPSHYVHPGSSLSPPRLDSTSTLISTCNNLNRRSSTLEEEEIDFSGFEKVKTALIGAGVELATDAIKKSQNKRDAPPASILLAIVDEFNKRVGVPPGFLKRKIENATTDSVPGNGWPASSSVRKVQTAPNDATRRDIMVMKLKSLRVPEFERDGVQIELHEWIDANIYNALAAGESIENVTKTAGELYQFLKGESNQ